MRLPKLKVRLERGADIGLISITEPYSGSLKANGSTKRGAYTDPLLKNSEEMPHTICSIIV